MSTNVQAPLVINGLNYTNQDGFHDTPYTYVYDVTLSANEARQNQVIPVFPDAAFAMRALVVSVNTGTFSVRFYDGQGYYLSSNQIHSANLIAAPSDPWVFFPEVLYPASGRIQLDITDLSGASNTIQICLQGVNRYPRR
jgi:hypothetical protein